MIINGITLTFEYASILLYVICLLTYYIRPHWPSKSSKWFVRIIIVGIISIAFNILVVLLQKHNPSILFFNPVRLFKDIYFLLVCILYIYLYKFFYSRFEFEKENKIDRYIHIVGIILISLISIVGLFTNFVFIVKNNKIIFGVGAYISMSIIAIYGLMILFFLFKNWKTLGRIKRLSVFFFIGIQLLALIVQSFLKDVLFTDFAISSYLFVLYLATYREEDYKDDDNILYNLHAFKQKVLTITNLKEDSYYIYILEIINYAAREARYGIQNMNESRVILNTRLENAFPNRIYSINKTRYAIISKINLDHKLEDMFIKNKFLLTIGDEEVRIIPVMGKFKVPNEFSDMGEVLFATYDNSYLFNFENHSISLIERNILLEKRRELLIEKEIRDSVSDKSFPLFMLPIYNIRESRYSAALVNLKCTVSNEIISNYELKKVAIEKGIILELENDLIAEIAKFIEKNRIEELNFERFFVELSTAEFNKKGRAESLIEAYKNNTKKCLKYLGVYLSEIPEIDLVDEIVSENIAALKKEGVKVFLNDYGSGYSTLNIISRFKFDGMKINSRIVHNAETIIDSHFMLEYLFNVAKDLGLDVSLPGINTESDLVVSDGHDVLYVSGNYFSGFISGDKLLELIKSNKKNESKIY